jgi:hypothetical protein
MRGGNNVMHQASFYNAVDSAIILSAYGGAELHRQRNKEGYRPLDIASLK